MTTLFVYGSLLLPELRRHVVGRDVELVAATLPGYRRRALHGVPYPGIRPCESESVKGGLLEGLRDDELSRLDAYEGGEYERCLVKVERLQGAARCGVSAGCSVSAECYVLLGEHEKWMSEEVWDLEAFTREHAPSYVAALRAMR